MANDRAVLARCYVGSAARIPRTNWPQGSLTQTVEKVGGFPGGRSAVGYARTHGLLRRFIGVGVSVKLYESGRIPSSTCRHVTGTAIGNPGLARGDHAPTA